MKTDRTILAIDQGTTSCRTIVFDRAGRALGAGQREFRQRYPKPGWVEHDALEIWRTQERTIADAMARARVVGGQIAGVGITNQRETTVVWNRETGRPVCPAIVWQDRRTSELCDRLKRDGVEPMVARKTGLRLDPYFSGTKLRWILENIAGARKEAERGRLLFGTIDSWLLWRLTGGKVHATDATNASRTLLYDIHSGGWDDELLALFGVPRPMLPEVRSSSEIYGPTDGRLRLGGAPVAGIAGDQQAALFGQACFSPGMAKNTYGTGCFLLMNTGRKAVPSRNNLLTTVAWRMGGKTEYALEGSVFIGGAVVQWLRDELRIVRDAQELDRLAASIPDAGGLYLVPAFAGLGAPHWDPYARGAAFGMTRGTGRAQFCRAALEAIALQSADLIACMEKDSGLKLSELRVDGGASRSDPLMQIQADLLGTRVVRPRQVETTALGAAYLAGLAVGYWESPRDIERNWAVGASFRRRRTAGAMAGLRRGWERALERAKGWESQK